MFIISDYKNRLTVTAIPTDDRKSISNRSFKAEDEDEIITSTFRNESLTGRIPHRKNCI